MAKIKLGDSEFEISRLTLRQLKVYLTIYKKIGTLDKRDPEMLDVAADLISAALIRKNPEMTPDFILDIEGTSADQMNVALQVIATESGLVPAGEIKPLILASSSGIESTDSLQQPVDIVTQ